MTTGVQVWFATVPSIAVAESLAKHLVEQGLVACVNIVPHVTSVYRWQGKVETGAECLLMIKAATNSAERLKIAFKNNHPYDVPELIAIDLVDGLPAYLDWVRAGGASLS